MRVAVIGAGGYIGSALVAELLSDAWPLEHLRLLDAVPISVPIDPRVEAIKGDFRDPAIVASAVNGADVVILLAAVLGGAAEANETLAWSVNVDATFRLFETLRRPGTLPRVVFASTIAVFGPPLPRHVDDDTRPAPVMTYGVHKLMMEEVLEQFSRRGWLDGVAIRYAGVVARPDADARLRSAFLNRVFYAVRDSEDITLPVSPGASVWLASVRQTAWNTAHAAFLPVGEFGARRAFTLPALLVSMEELLAALRRRFPGSAAKVEFVPDSDLEEQFGCYPPLETSIANRLGFQADQSIDALVRNAMNAPYQP